MLVDVLSWGLCLSRSHVIVGTKMTECGPEKMRRGGSEFSQDRLGHAAVTDKS